MDPGTALAVVSMAVGVVKDLYAYYCDWKDRDEDIAEIRTGLLWLAGVFEGIEKSLKHEGLEGEQKRIVYESIRSTQGIVDKLQKRLLKAKREGSPSTLLEKLDNKRRRALYPFQKATILRLLELIADFREKMHLVISLLNL